MNQRLDALLAQLDEGMRLRLTLIGGAEAETALRQWMTTRSHPVGWLRLTPAHNAAPRFIAALTAALQPLTSIALPKAVPELSPEDALIELLNALASAPETLALIIAGYEVITAPAIHAALSLMLDYLPPQLHLYLLGDPAPALPLPRLRVRRQLLEITTAAA